MPAVNLNRLYRPQARERRPILDNVHVGVGVPDAAGAHQRATMPALRAQLGIIGDEANSRIADVDRKSRAIQGAISTAGRLLDIVDRRLERRDAEMERARERQQANTLRHLHNEYDKYLLEHEEEIQTAEYGRTPNEDGGETVTGPYQKALDVLGKFQETDAYKAYESLEDEYKRAFDDYCGLEGAKLLNRYKKMQAELQQKDVLDGFTDRITVADAGARAHMDIEDMQDGSWMDAMEKLQEAGTAGTLYLQEIIDASGNQLRPMTREEAAQLAKGRRDIYEKYNLQRLDYFKERYIETGNTAYLKELDAWGLTAEEYAAKYPDGADGALVPVTEETQLRSDADRLAVRQMKADAEGKRKAFLEQEDARTIAGTAEELAAFSSGKHEGTEEEHAAVLANLRAVANGLYTETAQAAYMEKVENALVKANTELCALAFASLDDPGGRDALLSRLEGRIGELQSPTQVEALKKQIQNLKVGADVTDFNKAWEEQFGTADSPVQFESVDSTLAAIAALEKKARELKTPEARAAAFDRIQKRNTATATAEAEAKKEAISNILAWAEYGYIPVVLDDGRTGRKDATFDELLSAYRRLAPDMTVAQAAKVRSSLKDLAAKRAELPTEAEILQTFEWLGVKPSARREIFGDWGEDGRFERSARSLFAYGSDGWEIDKTAYERMDAPKPADRDGYISVRRSGSLGGGQIELTQDALGAVLGALQSYKRSQRLSDNPPTLEKVLGERLTSIRDRANAQSIIEAAKEATRIFDEQFDATIYYQTLED